MTRKEKQAIISQMTVFINGLPTDEEKDEIANEKPEEKVELLTVKECTKIIDGLSECTIRSLVKQNKLAHIRSGVGERGKILISKKALIQYFGGAH